MGFSFDGLVINMHKTVIADFGYVICPFSRDNDLMIVCEYDGIDISERCSSIVVKAQLLNAFKKIFRVREMLICQLNIFFARDEFDRYFYRVTECSIRIGKSIKKITMLVIGPTSLHSTISQYDVEL